MYYFLLRLPFYQEDVCWILYIVLLLMETDWTSCRFILEFHTFSPRNTFTLIFIKHMIFWTLFIHTSLITFKISCFSVDVRITDLIGKGIRRGSKQEGWRCDENLITFHFSLSSERGLQNKCELVFNILVINVKAPAHHICTWCDCRWQISQTCYLSSPQLTLFFCVGLFVLLGSDGGFNQESRQFINPKEGACTTLTERTWF